MGIYNGSKHFYGRFISAGEALQPFFLLAIRLFWGWSFLWTGWGKILSIGKTASHFATLSIPFPELAAHLVGWVEFLGGIFLLAGFASRMASSILAIVMIVALLTAHNEAVWTMFTNQGKFISQTPVTYLMTVLTVFCFGPGMFSLDALFKRFIFKRKK